MVIKMKVKTNAKVVTAMVYDKKDKQTKEPTGEKGLMITLLIDERDDNKLSGRVISPFVDPLTYKGILDFSSVNRLDEVEVELEVPSNPRGLFALYNLERIEKKK